MDISSLLNPEKTVLSGLDYVLHEAQKEYELINKSPKKHKLELEYSSDDEEPKAKKTKLKNGLLTPEQEEEVVEWVMNKNEAGFFPTRKEVITMADSLIVKEGNNERRKPTLDHAWCLRFQNRHPQLKLQTSSSKGKYFDVGEEDEIVQWVKAKNQQGIIPASQDVIDFAMQIAYRKDTHKLRLSSSWVCLFANRHKDIHIKLISSECVNENTRRHINLAEEEELVRWVKQHNQMGEYPTKRQVTDKAYEMAKQRNPDLLPFSRWWANRFITLHPELKFKINGKR